MGPTPSRQPLRVALLGLGNVGRSVAARLVDEAWRAGVAQRGTLPPELVAVGVRDPDRPRGIQLPESVRRSADLASLAVDPDVDVIVELIGGVDEPRALVVAALAAGKRVVTANKALLAHCGMQLEAQARRANAALRFEASVAGGVPVMAAIVRDLAANRIDAIRGVINGTTNHILTAMARDARTYEDVLDEARARGYAEADPTADVSGMDAASKLAILIRLTFGGWPQVASIRRSVPSIRGVAPDGISGVTAIELHRAATLELTLKLVARAERTADGSIAAGATLAAVPLGSPLGDVPGVTNLVELLGEPIGRVTFRGPGAGGDATSSAVLGDVLGLARGEGSTWDALPAAGAIDVIDDLTGPRAWFFAAPELRAAGMPRSITDVALVTSEDAVVTRRMDVDDLRVRLATAGVEDLTLYPVLEMGQG